MIYTLTPIQMHMFCFYIYTVPSANIGVVEVLEFVAKVGDGVVQSVVAVAPVNKPSVSIMQDTTMVGGDKDLVCQIKIISLQFS